MLWYQHDFNIRYCDCNPPGSRAEILITIDLLQTSLDDIMLPLNIRYQSYLVASQDKNCVNSD